MAGTHLDEHTYGTGKKKLSIYIIGMVLCVILTLVPFMSLMYDVLSDAVKMTIIFASAIIQFVVQVLCFLRLNASNEQSRMNLMSFVFTIVILVALIGGSVWIMKSLHYNMMMDSWSEMESPSSSM